MLQVILLLVTGFALLLLGADWLVKGGSSLAKRFDVPEIVIGLTIVAFGTSTPELFVNIISNLHGTTDICFGDPIGSNIVNILVILGLTAIICPLPVKKDTVWREIPFSVGATVLVFLLANNFWLGSTVSKGLSRWDSAILLFAFAMFMVYIWKLTKRHAVEESNIKMYSLPLSLVAIVVGIVGLIIGGRIVVNQAVLLAASIGISQKVIGLTIVAFGTSLPELATSVMAALKKHPDIALGNVVGSNIFNLLFILGTSSMMRPLPFKSSFNGDFLVLFIVSATLLIAMYSGKKQKIDRWEGGVMVTMYVVYVASLIR